MVYAQPLMDFVPVVIDGKVMQPDNEPKPNVPRYRAIESLSFMLEFDEVEDFIVEVREQLEAVHVTGCDLIVT